MCTSLSIPLLFCLFTVIPLLVWNLLYELNPDELNNYLNQNEYLPEYLNTWYMNTTTFNETCRGSLLPSFVSRIVDVNATSTDTEVIQCRLSGIIMYFSFVGIFSILYASIPVASQQSCNRRMKIIKRVTETTTVLSMVLLLFNDKIEKYMTKIGIMEKSKLNFTTIF